MRWDVPLASGVAVFGDDLVRRGQKAAEGLYLSTTYVPEFAGPDQAAFQESFAREFGKRKATHREAQVYDSLKLAVEALDAVGTSRVKVTEYLTSIGRESQPYHGVSGDFAPSKHLNARPAYVVRVVDGQYQIVEPTVSPEPTESSDSEGAD